ncbi:MAG: LysR family transcriptional regulator, partial [bacterium]|nr:LysR family transcriptional regulator [bacterium]
MELEDLVIFNHLATTLNFGETAEAFYMSPSNLTWRIKNLEKELGTQLFERDTRNVSLSPDGRLFATFATNTTNNWELIKNEFQNSNRPLQGQVRLFASVTGTYSFMPKLLKKIRLEHPELDIILQSGPVQNGIERLTNNDCDIAIMAIPETQTNNLEYRTLSPMPLIAI